MSSGDTSPPPGWYPDPGGTGHRWWDGAGWTSHQHVPENTATQPTTGSTPVTSSRLDTIDIRVMLGAAGAILLLIATALPWISDTKGSYNAYDRGLPWFISGSSLPDDSPDGVFSVGFLAHGIPLLVLAIIIAVGAFMTFQGQEPQGPRLMFGAGAIASVLILIDFFWFRRSFAGFTDVGTSWGLWIGFIASLIGATAGGLATDAP